MYLLKLLLRILIDMVQMIRLYIRHQYVMLSNEFY
ncbi:hypothetical protein vBEcoMWL3_gp247c [Escherichia phage vB_EcoM_WL-3]|nr:hypothetical protein vBEcoMWL3_gp247c [Escherichia phage vB_EcoM_WL-3]